MMDPMQFLGVMQQELEHQRQLMELMPQMQQMRQMQHQEQQAHEAQTQQGAPHSGGNERQSQQLIMKGFDEFEVFSGGEEQWQNWSWKIKTVVSGMNEEFTEMLRGHAWHEIEVLIRGVGGLMKMSQNNKGTDERLKRWQAR